MKKIRVSAPARIHMGIFNPSRGVRGRLYGSVGVGTEEPRTVVEVEQAKDIYASTPFADEIKFVAMKIVRHYNLEGARVNVLSAPKRHSGLGSTTQLSLSIATGITRAYGLDVKPVDLAMILGRGKQSAAGTYVFQMGGFVVDGGWGAKTSFPPLLIRYTFPEDWRLLIVVPESRGLDEKDELEAFEKLPAPDEQLIREASYRLLLGMAPAIMEKDIQAFGESLTKLQETVGAMFSQAQGGVFQPHSTPMIEKLKAMGAAGVGQSSWGPAVYAIFDAETGKSVEALLRREVLSGGSTKQLGSSLYGASKWGEVYFTRADNRGAVVT
ncbi:MAG: beta-ribofuranosylaminobenzene 5'-phosphate synthase family protein [Promethearchaeati archaeon SRVP18_Atabeyarchaeia-1]